MKNLVKKVSGVLLIALLIVGCSKDDDDKDISPPPNLSVSVFSVSNSNPSAGASITLSATVRNLGGQSGSSTLTYYRSTDATISSTDTRVGTDAVSSLSANGTGNESISITVPSSPGTYYYGVCMSTVSGETVTNNNCSVARSVTIAQPITPPDLSVSSFSVSNSSPSAGANITLSAIVRNLGGQSSSSTLTYYRSTNSTISSTDTRVGTDAVSSLSANGTGNETITITVPTTPGTYYYGACVSTVSGETVTNNNCSVGRSVTVAGSTSSATSWIMNVSNLSGETVTFDYTPTRIPSLSNGSFSLSGGVATITLKSGGSMRLTGLSCSENFVIYRTGTSTVANTQRGSEHCGVDFTLELI